MLTKAFIKMNTIITNKVQLTAKELFKIYLSRYIKRRWWVYAVILLAIIFLSIDGFEDSFEVFVVVFGIVYPILLCIQLWRYVKSKKNKIIFLERHFEIDDNKICGIIDKDTYSPIKLEHFIKVERVRDAYLLFISKNQFIYIPFDAFQNASDKDIFENEIITRIGK